MAKELGMIHTVSDSLTVSAQGQRFLTDLSGELSNQLQRRIRQGQYYKTVGWDLNLRPHPTTPTLGGIVSGRIKYYLPTKGRCAAYRNAYNTMMSIFKDQGISIRQDKRYDFRVAFDNTSQYVNGAQFINVSSIDGSNQLDMSSNNDNDIFQVYNQSVVPAVQGTPVNSTGFGAYGSTSDYILNDGATQFGNPDFANTDPEILNFTVSYDGTNKIGDTLQLRADPALYIAILAGQFEILIDTVDFEVGASSLILDVNTHVAGWKSIIQTPGKRTKRKEMKQ